MLCLFNVTSTPKAAESNAIVLLEYIARHSVSLLRSVNSIRPLPRDSISYS